MKIKKNKKIELLAPAKDKETAFCAIKYGADAVYIGCSDFGARKNAGNSLQDIQEVVDYAHKFYAKVYVTVNTLFFDDELKDVENLIWNIYKAGVDAIIIQDMSVFELNLPPIQIFASTQCHNNSLEKIKFFEQLGLKRVILARELSLEEIKNISDNTNIEIETFVHGALCVSYSGQCYLSLANGGRSANRGECAQPCRKKYSLYDENNNLLLKDKYILSLKDFNASKHINDLLNAGVTSFKIEGRLKNISYVKNVVAYYRKLIDKILNGQKYNKTSSGVINYDFEPDLYKSFNRGFTDYFLISRQKDIVNFYSQKSLGEPIGEVIEVKNNSFKVKSDKIFNKQDGICFYSKNGDLCGTLINDIKSDYIFPKDISNIKAGTFIYRNSDVLFDNMLENSKTERKILVDLKIYENENKIYFEALDEAFNTVQFEVINDFESAKTPQKENWKKQFSKLGDTIFKINSIFIDIQEEKFIPIKTLNDIRRNLFEMLETERLKNYKRAEQISFNKNISFPVKDLDYSFNVINNKSKTFYENCGCSVSQCGLDSTKNFTGKNLMTTKHCLRYALGKCSKITKNNSDWIMVDEKNQKYNLIFDCKNCIMKIVFNV